MSSRPMLPRSLPRTMAARSSPRSLASFLPMPRSSRVMADTRPAPASLHISTPLASAMKLPPSECHRLDYLRLAQAQGQVGASLGGGLALNHLATALPNRDKELEELSPVRQTGGLQGQVRGRPRSHVLAGCSHDPLQGSVAGLPQLVADGHESRHGALDDL